MPTDNDLDVFERVRASFNRQAFMTLLNATLEHVAPGAVDIALPYRPDLTQQDGYMHAAVTTAIADTACGYAALSLAPAGYEVLSVEFKLNLLRPAVGERFVAHGRVLKPGRTLSVVRGDVVALAGDHSTMIATMLATMILQPIQGK